MAKRILFCDDNADLRRYYGRAVERLGCESVIVDDAARAWEVVQSGEHFDLIFSDNDMPELTGIEFLKLVREHEATKQTAFVLFTGNDSSELERTARELGACFEDKGNMRSLLVIIGENLPKS
jgi:CheY-like chemotaxis protein